MSLWECIFSRFPLQPINMLRSCQIVCRRDYLQVALSPTFFPCLALIASVSSTALHRTRGTRHQLLSRDTSFDARQKSRNIWVFGSNEWMYVHRNYFIVSGCLGGTYGIWLLFRARASPWGITVMLKRTALPLARVRRNERQICFRESWGDAVERAVNTTWRHGEGWQPHRLPGRVVEPACCHAKGRHSQPSSSQLTNT